MRVSRQEMESSHARIVEGASRLLRERGLAGVSVADAMNGAGMTHGGFYRHFKTKDDLVVEALQLAFDEFVGPLEASQLAGAAELAVKEFEALYLSNEHVANPALGCPLPALAADAGRGQSPVKTAFSAGLNRVIAALAAAQQGEPEQQLTEATRKMAMLVGAVNLARATDEKTGQAVLEACRA